RAPRGGAGGRPPPPRAPPAPPARGRQAAVPARPHAPGPADAGGAGGREGKKGRHDRAAMSAKAKLLVVDDNEMNRDTLSRQLERAGYEVKTAAEGLEALEMIDTQPFDLVLLDVMMPGLTGTELLKIVRAEHPANELPIIMATARDKSENMVEALSLGANDYVTKPLDFPVVLARVEAHLKMKNAAQAAKVPPPPRQPGVA